jgi:hypothetical protein
MKMTFNRRLILLVLSEDSEGTPPPHSASTIHSCLENAFNYKWRGLYESMKALPNKQQIHRTLRELWQGGLIVGSRVKEDYNADCLPRWVIEYQLSGEVGRNALIAECNEVYRKVNTAKNGLRLFSSVFDRGLPAAEVKPLLGRIKVLMQKTHPDKAPGYEFEFKQMKQCAAWIRQGIPLPTPTHAANEKVALKLTYPK